MLTASLTRPTKREPGRAAPPIRVAFVIDQLGRAGTETQLLALIRGLDRSRVQPSLVLLDGEHESSRALEPADCPVTRLGVKRLASGAALRAARRLAAAWRAEPPDIVQVYFLDSAYFAVPLARWCGVPRVVRVRNNLGYWLTRSHRLFNRIVGRAVDVTVTNAEAGRQALVAEEGLAAERIAVIANGVDLDRFQDFPPPDTSRPGVRIGCVANLRPVKNIDGLLRAARIVCDRHPTAVFEIAGEGEQRAELERLRATLRLENRFLLQGSVADVPGFLRDVDIAVLPSHSEGMSNALLESLAAGRAVVATDVGANARLLDGGQCGLVVPPGDDSLLAAAIERLLADSALARRLGAAARSHVEREHGRAAMVRRFEAFFENLARSSSRS